MLLFKYEMNSIEAIICCVFAASIVIGGLIAIRLMDR